jgi:hypothetical protein
MLRGKCLAAGRSLPSAILHSISRAPSAGYNGYNRLPVQHRCAQLRPAQQQQHCKHVASAVHHPSRQHLTPSSCQVR